MSMVICLLLFAMLLVAAFLLLMLQLLSAFALAVFDQVVSFAVCPTPLVLLAVFALQFFDGFRWFHPADPLNPSFHCQNVWATSLRFRSFEGIQPKG